MKPGPFLTAISCPALHPPNLPSIHWALPPFFCLSTNCHGNGCSPILLGSLCKWHLCLTVTGFKIILRAWRQVIKLNFQPVAHMNVANEWWIKRAMGGGAIHPLSPVKTLHSRLVLPPPPSSSNDGRWDTQVQALRWEQKKITVPKLHHLWNLWAAVQPKATAEHKHITGIFSDFSFGAAHTMYFADRQLIYYTWQKCQAVLAARHITSEQSQRDWRIMSNRTRPADPSCNMDSHLAGHASSTNYKLKMKYGMKKGKAWDQMQ